jgi:transcriptional regulator with XRE-family HTH domain
MRRTKRTRNLVGAQIRKMRMETGLSQSDLAASCQRIGWDVSRDTIAAIEGRSRLLADFELILLAQVLQQPLLAFFPEGLAITPQGMPSLPAPPSGDLYRSLGLDFGSSQGGREKGHLGRRKD